MAWAAADLLAVVAQLTERRHGSRYTDAARALKHAGWEAHRRRPVRTPPGWRLRPATTALLPWACCCRQSCVSCSPSPSSSRPWPARCGDCARRKLEPRRPRLPAVRRHSCAPDCQPAVPWHRWDVGARVRTPTQDTVRRTARRPLRRAVADAAVGERQSAGVRRILAGGGPGLAGGAAGGVEWG